MNDRNYLPLNLRTPCWLENSREARRRFHGAQWKLTKLLLALLLIESVALALYFLKQ